jgi:hypothetical protein
MAGQVSSLSTMDHMVSLSVGCQWWRHRWRQDGLFLDTLGRARWLRLSSAGVLTMTWQMHSASRGAELGVGERVGEDMVLWEVNLRCSCIEYQT